MVGVAPVCVGRGGFLVASHLSPDYDGRLQLLRSGYVETNPGPDSGARCSACGDPMGTYRSPLRCEARCGAVSHRKSALEGLIRIVGSGAAQAVNPPGGRGYDQNLLNQNLLVRKSPSTKIS